MSTLDAIVASVRSASPDLVDEWEVIAIVEAAGYSDARVRDEFKLADARALGRAVYERLRRERRPPAPRATEPGRGRRMREALASFAGDFFNSVVYAVPWLVMFWMQHVRPEVFAVPGELAAPLMLAIMGSLVVAGGAVQAIARKGVFYTSLGERAVAYRVTRKLFDCGAAVAVAAGAMAAAAAWYFSLFPAPAIFLALNAYVTLSVLWMVCALITIEGRRWRVPVVFGLAAGAYLGLSRVGLSTVAAQLGAAYAALACGGAFAAADRRRVADPPDAFLPKTRVLVHSLAPYVWYGTLYFALLFADRLVGATARLLGGAAFGVDAAYAQATDVALVSFLLMAALVEHLNTVFMRFLRREMTQRTATDARLARAIGRRHLMLLLVVAALFPVIDAICRSVSISLRPLAGAPGGWPVLVPASAGYLCLAIGLLNALILLSMNRPFAVVSSFASAVIVDVVTGGLAAAVLGAAYAVLGLTLGAAWLALRTTSKVNEMLAWPAHAYAAL